MSEITAGRAQKLTTPRVRPRSGAWSAVARGERSSPGPRRGRGRAAPAARGGGPGCAPHSSPPARPLPPPPLSRATFSGPVPSSMDRVLHCSAKSASSCPFERWVLQCKQNKWLSSRKQAKAAKSEGCNCNSVARLCENLKHALRRCGSWYRKCYAINGNLNWGGGLFVEPLGRLDKIRITATNNNNNTVLSIDG